MFAVIDGGANAKAVVWTGFAGTSCGGAKSISTLLNRALAGTAWRARAQV